MTESFSLYGKGQTREVGFIVHLMNISMRLKTVATYLPKGAYFLDVGTDHAYLPCYVCSQDQTAYAIASEINTGPYQNALNTVKKYELNHVIDVRLGNGLQVLSHDEKLRQVVITGMGGKLITQILNGGSNHLESVERLILQPNTGERQVREWLYYNHYGIISEEILAEKGRIYEIIVADRGADQPYDHDQLQKEFYFGPCLMKEQSKEFVKKWRSEHAKLSDVIQQIERSTKQHKRLNSFKRQRDWIEEVLRNGFDSSF